MPSSLLTERTGYGRAAICTFCLKENWRLFSLDCGAVLPDYHIRTAVLNGTSTEVPREAASFLSSWNAVIHECYSTLTELVR